MSNRAFLWSLCLLSAAVHPASPCVTEELEMQLTGPRLDTWVDASEKVGEDALTHPDWDNLLGVVAILETGTVDERLQAANRMYWNDYIEALDAPPDGDQTRVRETVERLRAYIATEPKSWIVQRVTQDITYCSSEELIPLLSDLTRHPAPTVRTTAIDNFYNDYEIENWLPEERIQRDLLKLWASESYTPARTALLEAMSYHEAELPYTELAKWVTDDDQELAEAAIDYTVWMEPDGWVDLLLGLIRVDETVAGRAAIRLIKERAQYTFSEPDGERLRAFFEPLLSRDGFGWARPELLPLLARLDSGVLEAELRRMIAGHSPGDVSLGLRILAQMNVPDWAEVVARRAMHGEEESRVIAFHWMASQTWDPVYESAVRRIADTPASPHLASAAWIGIGVGDSLPDDRAHMAVVRDRLRDASDRLEEPETGAQENVVGPTRLEQSPARYAVAPPGQYTVRCFRAPDCEGPVQGARRLPTGHPVDGDRFDDVLTSWWEVDTESDCWVDDVHTLSAEQFEPAEDAPDPEHAREVEVSQLTARSSNYLKLKKYKVLETFDVGRRLVGCRLTVDVQDRERLEWLRDATGLSRTNIADGVRYLLPKIRETYGSTVGWEEWIRSTPEE